MHPVNFMAYNRPFCLLSCNYTDGHGGFMQIKERINCNTLCTSTALFHDIVHLGFNVASIVVFLFN